MEEKITSYGEEETNEIRELEKEKNIKIDEKIETVVKWKNKYPDFIIGKEINARRYFSKIARSEEEHEKLIEGYTKIKKYYLYINAQNSRGKLSEEQKNKLRESGVNYEIYGYPKIVEETSQKFQISKQKANKIIVHFGTFENMLAFVKKIQTMSEKDLNISDNVKKIDVLNTILKDNLKINIDVCSSQYEANYDKLMFDLNENSIASINFYNSKIIMEKIQQMDDEEEKEELPIEEIGLSVVAYNALRRYGITKVKDIQGKKWKRIKRIGKFFAEEIVDACNSIGIPCKVGEEGYFEFEYEDENIEETQATKKISKSSKIEKLKISGRLYNRLARVGIENIEDLEGVNLLEIRSLGKKGATDIVEICNNNGFLCDIDKKGIFHFIHKDENMEQEGKDKPLEDINELDIEYSNKKIEQYLGYLENLQEEVVQLENQQKLFEQYIEEGRFILPDPDYKKEQVEGDVDKIVENNIKDEEENCEEKKKNLQQIEKLLHQIGEIDRIATDISQQIMEEKAKKSKLLEDQPEHLQGR